MTEYFEVILNDSGFLGSITLFSGLYLSVFLVGYFISLIVGLLNKITHNA